MADNDVVDVQLSDTLCHGAQKHGMTREEVFRYYDNWADRYDKDLHDLNYNGPRQCAEALAEVLSGNKAARILDVAAGTGLCATELLKLGYTNLDAIDGSQGMLDIAKSRNLYHRYICDFLGPRRLDIEDDHYDAIACCGSFSQGHLKDDCFPELIRIVKPGGLICIAMREEFLHTVEAYRGKLEPAMVALENKGCWERIARDIVPKFYREKDGVVFIYRVLAQ
ncbi:PREDICTED: Williams-Beuren syndrome chromosomal region 27 protein-like [Branchiostoma belcheri]|uniref:Williams-Beuren syndrome chromosomal region 27 protein-like n=1 Tax=Branchiostoma belcheri TaxID=7741 RepID=A0A6P4ZGE5_BRABE|nr:PREDICTED: Williams-Beuren syndrome chromosomal region 27 protein-like [Branchiostoma belcheri]XP_019635808.1 PREDICTED: Williams-Beuren syndrome chromosomal region 27 protein-like [Branchiostoma belcheri]XP_019635809.1 PREDICTED: Williams-Beuren syndrome chromosomal region 27 protein-like [Branchiostoma belcheri]XP_019635810.1 PREDICTED: Williams-Beuren syndrome chromosomal region 27 protein-like [Branchiostoma belcheri]